MSAPFRRHPLADDADLRAAHPQSLRNRADLSRGGRCGCSHCLAVFDASEVREWVGRGTALRPRRGTDAVLSAHVAPVDPGFLERMRRRYFGRVTRWDRSDPRHLDDAP